MGSQIDQDKALRKFTQALYDKLSQMNKEELEQVQSYMKSDLGGHIQSMKEELDKDYQG